MLKGQTNLSVVNVVFVHMVLHSTTSIKKIRPSKCSKEGTAHPNIQNRTASSLRKDSPVELASFNKSHKFGRTFVWSMPTFRFSTASPRSRANRKSVSTSKTGADVENMAELSDLADFERTRPVLHSVRRRFVGDDEISGETTPMSCRGNAGSVAENGSAVKASSKSQEMEGNASSFVGSSAKTAAMSNSLVTLVHSRVEGSSVLRRLEARSASFFAVLLSASVAGPAETASDMLLVRIRVLHILCIDFKANDCIDVLRLKGWKICRFLLDSCPLSMLPSMFCEATCCVCADEHSCMDKSTAPTICYPALFPSVDVSEKYRFRIGSTPQQN